jgi:subtilase family serine protease
MPGIVVPVRADTGTLEYTLPLTITNSGGSDAPAFTVTVYLDGEKIADKRIEAGLAAHATADIAIPVFITPGSHELKVVADEAGIIRDNTRDNNLAQGRYEFPA